MTAVVPEPGIPRQRSGKKKVFEQSHLEGFSAEEVGQQIGASRTTARRYLEYLTAAGQLTAELIYGAVGRPERKYFSV